MIVRFARLLLAGVFSIASLPQALRSETPTAPLKPEWALSAEPVVPLEQGWADPPKLARTQCWWWWLNGNVTKDAITRDLEAMKANGLGGANIIDAGGADQRDNEQVPHGPDFGTPEWRELFVHALAEADRLGLELGFNIQSGWNLGGPTVKPEHAAKKLTWAETTVGGGQPIDVELPQPKQIGGFYRDIAVLAIGVSRDAKERNSVQVSAESAQLNFPADLAVDGDPNTFWISGTEQPGDGPSVEHPVLLKMEFATAVSASQLVMTPRDEYGPKRGWLQCADNPQNWRVDSRWTAGTNGTTTVNFPRTTARLFRLVIVDAHDPRSPVMPRNVQIAEVQLMDEGKVVAPLEPQLARIGNFRQKVYDQYPGAFTAPNAEFLLDARRSNGSERVVRSAGVIDLTKHVGPQGRLQWEAPEGGWRVLRIGYTLSGSKVSTSSEGWNGWAIDYMDSSAFDEYWREVIEPLMAAAKPYIGRSLKFLHTDSWELGPVNWTPALPQEFKRRRGYEMTRYLPALAGYVVDDRAASNRFLNDFRRTLGDLVADGKYATFRAHAHELGLGIHPESGGPHAAPIDALMCLGRNDIAMGEFWARSKTHRVRDEERLFIKQAASAAHIYGKRVVLAESFTSIGPQWEEDPSTLKPVFDQVACEGLNLVMLHTFDCSPDEMGEPGQAYFAGTHVNRHVTWWPHGDAFFGYLNRCQFMLQQGLPVSDVLYFYGENVPSFVRLKADDPANVLPGYDYDVINAEALIERTAVHDGKIVLPERTSYEVLVLPPGGSYGLRALEHVAELVRGGARVIGPRPKAPIGLTSAEGEAAFQKLVGELWAAKGDHAIRDVRTRDVLKSRGTDVDFAAAAQDSEPAQVDFIHRRTTDADIYFIVNRRDRWQDVDCSFRIAGRQPELWNPQSAGIADASAFRQVGERTVVPLRFAPNGSMFVVFRRPIAANAEGLAKSNEPRCVAAQQITGTWRVQFEPRLGGPTGTVDFASLLSWTDRNDSAVRYYSGPATYRLTFDVDAMQRPNIAGRRWWLDLGAVKNIASVKLNGSELGVAWTPPYRVDVTDHIQATGNELEIEVTNLWPNRLIGDARLPLAERITRTNITKFTGDSPLLKSGLMGPVQLMVEE